MKKIIEDIDPQPICSQLKALRLSLGFASAKRFAEHLGVNYTTYRNYEKDRLPPIELLFLIKAKYAHRVNIDRLFNSIITDAQIGGAGPRISPEGMSSEYAREEKRTGKDRRNGLAYESCDRLLEIERLNRAVFLLTVGDIKSRLWALEHLETPGDTLCNNPKSVEDKPA